MIEIKKLNEDRWHDYRDLRLEALKSEPIAFASSDKEEQLLPEPAWRERIDNVLLPRWIMSLLVWLPFSVIIG